MSSSFFDEFGQIGSIGTKIWATVGMVTSCKVNTSRCLKFFSRWAHRGIQGLGRAPALKGKDTHGKCFRVPFRKPSPLERPRGLLKKGTRRHDATPGDSPGKVFSSIASIISGGGKGIRTLDPSVANAVLSQLNYAPTKM
jgi:hypothetical protein